MAHTDFRAALEGANEIEITVIGRTSGRAYSYPVWFALEGDKLYLLPERGAETEWYKNLRKTPTIQMSARGGKTLSTSVRLITNQAQHDKILEQFRDKYGRTVESYPNVDVAVEVPLE